MSQKKDKIIGIRLTNTEKEEVDKYIKNTGSNITEFIRQAIDFYINNLNEKPESIHMGNVVEYSKKVKLSLGNVNNTFNQLKLALDDLSDIFTQLDRELVISIGKRVI
jgi:predicted DNA-binding protein